MSSNSNLCFFVVVGASLLIFFGALWSTNVLYSPPCYQSKGNYNWALTTIQEEDLKEDSPTSSATSGKLFKGEKIRSFSTSQLKFGSFEKNKKVMRKSNHNCEVWSVVTTIFEPSEAVIKQSELKGWCLVVVGDRKTPKEYVVKNEDPNSYVFLTWQMQEDMAKRFPLSDNLPWNHFGRKNMGFLYAIMNGAKYIWDFDDDNILLDANPLYVLPGKGNGSPNPHIKFTGSTYEAIVPAVLHRVEATSTNEQKNESKEAARARKLVERELVERRSIWPTTCGLVANPYPLMGAETSPCWPRGFPLECIQRSNDAYGTPADQAPHLTKLPSNEIGIIQSLANHDPDVDGIYRLTMPLPFDFPQTPPYPLVLPWGVYAPYNAQATMHMHSALWALLLPITVHGRVSDIWRGYIATRLGQDIGMRPAFAPPIVEQIRNAHSYLADFDSEQPLYLTSLKLIEQMSAWAPSEQAKSLPARMEELWVFLYEHGYIEVKDVYVLQQWIQALIDVGYQFPILSA